MKSELLMNGKAVAKLMHRLGGQAAIGHEGVAVADRREGERPLQRRPQCPRQLRQIPEIGDAWVMAPGEDLPGPIRTLAACGEPRGEPIGMDLADRRDGPGG